MKDVPHQHNVGIKYIPAKSVLQENNCHACSLFLAYLRRWSFVTYKRNCSSTGIESQLAIVTTVHVAVLLCLFIVLLTQPSHLQVQNRRMHGLLSSTYPLPSSSRPLLITINRAAASGGTNERFPLLPRIFPLHFQCRLLQLVCVCAFPKKNIARAGGLVCWPAGKYQMIARQSYRQVFPQLLATEVASEPDTISYCIHIYTYGI